MSIFDVAFVKAAGERAIKTFCQALVAVFAAGVTVIDVDWMQALAVAGTAAVLSILTSVASNHVGSYYGPSLSDEAVMTVADDDE